MLFKNKKPKVLCLGSVGKDIFFPLNLSNNENSVGENRFCLTLGDKVHIENRYVSSGGGACNFSIGLSRANIFSAILTLAGEDSDGDWIEKILIKEKVNVKNFKRDKKSSTDLSVILVDSKNGERTILVSRDVGEKLNLENEEKVLQKFDWIFIESLYGDNVLKNAKIIHDLIKKSEIKLVYNPGQRNITHNQNEVLGLLRHTSLLFVNKNEAQQIVKFLKPDVDEKSLKSEEQLLKILRDNTDKATVVLTDGSRGAWSFDGEKFYYEPASTEKVVDTTGAGDAFASGFFSAILYGNSPEKAMKWGMRNSFSVIKYYGAIEGLLNLEKFEEIK